MLDQIKKYFFVFKALLGICSLILSLLSLTEDKYSECSCPSGQSESSYCGFQYFTRGCTFTSSNLMYYNNINCSTSTNAQVFYNSVYHKETCFSSGYETVKSAGLTFFSFTIIGSIFTMLGVGFVLSENDKLRTPVKIAHFAAAISFIIAFATWSSDGCQQNINEDFKQHCSLGRSFAMVVSACVLNFLIAIFDFF